MLCKSPFVRDPSGKVFKASILSGLKELGQEIALQGVPFPCGQCLPCRINKRRVWTHRLMLESYCHVASSFVTLTYNDDNVPSDGSLSKRHVQLFLKRLRKCLGDSRIRYYCAGEYGEKGGRRHYHLIIFGLSPDISTEEIIEKCWNYGFVTVDPCVFETVQYVAGYVTKKIIRKGDSREKEFALMSRKPGIGYPALGKLSELLELPAFRSFLQLKGDIPDGLKHGNRFLPFGRYLRDKLRAVFDCNGDIDGFLNEMKCKWMEARTKNLNLTELLMKESEQRNRQIEARFKIYNNRDKL